MAEVETDIEGVETEVNSYQNEIEAWDGRCKDGRKGDCKRKLKEVLNQLETECERVTIFLQTGSKCCKQTGCICDVNDCFVVLLADDNPCKRTYILLDCICAVENCIETSCSYDGEYD